MRQTRSNLSNVIRYFNHQSIIYFNTLRQRAKKLVQDTNVGFSDHLHLATLRLKIWISEHGQPRPQSLFVFQYGCVRRETLGTRLVMSHEKTLLLLHL